MPTEKRYDRLGPLVSMAAKHGYVMVRRPGRMPFVLSGREWASLSKEPVKALEAQINAN